MVAIQLQTYLYDNNLLEQFQSGFRSRHSTETALVKITNDLLRAADAGLLSILILLDLSAAFDTISHQLLLERLESIGVCGTALKWFAHYLTARTYFVKIEDHQSKSSALQHGVPQGSVLGPLLFIIYLLPLGNILRHHGIHFHSYADDIQLYVSTKPTATLPPNTLTTCIHDIQAWMTTNYLQINSNKTEVLLIGTPSILSKSNLSSVSIGEDVIPVSKQVKSLGVTLDSNFSFSNHINNVCRTAYFHLRNISRLRPSLSQHSTEVLVNTLVTSRIDYCNAILQGIPNKLLHRLQLLQNSAARIITRTKSIDHTPADSTALAPHITTNQLQSLVNDIQSPA